MNTAANKGQRNKRIRTADAKWRSPFRDATIALPSLRCKLEQLSLQDSYLRDGQQISRSELDIINRERDQVWETIIQYSLSVAAIESISLEELATKARYLTQLLDQDPDDIAAQLAMSLTRDILSFTDNILPK